MAGLQERNGSYRIIFRYRCKQRSITLGKVSLQEAEAYAGKVDLLLLASSSDFSRSLPPVISSSSSSTTGNRPKNRTRPSPA